MTGCLEGRFRQGVNLRVSRSEGIQVARECPLVTVVFRPFWHARGTDVCAERSDRKRPAHALPYRESTGALTWTFLFTSPGGCGAPHGAFFPASIRVRHSNHLQVVGPELGSKLALSMIVRASGCAAPSPYIPLLRSTYKP